MKKQELLELIGKYGSIRKIAIACECSPSTIRHWLRKYEIRTRSPSIKQPRCNKCGETDPQKFYYRSNGNIRTGYCKKCHSQYYTEQRREKKKQAIIHKGGICERCGLKTEHYSVYDFHHLKGSDKEFDWRRLCKFTWDKIMVELDKCELLCSNCHRIEHEDDFNHTYS